jgi:hypothetical protein
MREPPAGVDHDHRTKGRIVFAHEKVHAEMCRVGRITDGVRIQEEIDVYGALLPRPGELSATLMIEIADKDQIKLVFPDAALLEDLRG